MREIKFRGLTKYDELKFGCLVRTTNGKAYILQINSTTIEEYNQNWLINTPAFEVLPDSISEFTGLKDKNGIEIYENDILKENRYNIAPVEYHNGIAAFSWSKGIDWGMIEPSGIEVIGNIYQNAELLPVVA